ncbi:MAG: hypothetical protein QXL01_05825 [Thermoplasmatales archaeon]
METDEAVGGSRDLFIQALQRSVKKASFILLKRVFEKLGLE